MLLSQFKSAKGPTSEVEVNTVGVPHINVCTSTGENTVTTGSLKKESDEQAWSSTAISHDNNKEKSGYTIVNKVRT